MGPPTHSRHRTDQRHDRTNGLAANRSLARDFTDVKFTDSTVLHALTYGQTRIAENDEDTLAIIAPTGGIARRLLTLTGLQEQTPQTRHAPTRSPSPDRVSPPTWAKFECPPDPVGPRHRIPRARPRTGAHAAEAPSGRPRASPCGHSAPWSRRTTGRRACLAWRVRATRAPAEGRFAAATVPPCASAIARTIARPRPRPFVDGVPAAVERLEDRVQLGGVEAGARVVDLDRDRPVVDGRRHLDDATGRRVPERVVDQVVERLPDPCAVELHDCVQCLGLQRDAGSVGCRGERVPALLDQRRQRHR